MIFVAYLHRFMVARRLGIILEIIGQRVSVKNSRVLKTMYLSLTMSIYVIRMSISRNQF